ncbi:MAG: UDP-N-acetylglucosamine--LPS N-acetylglucosamine transferase [Pseudomonadota bacterium]
MLLRPAFQEYSIRYVTTMAGLPEKFDALPAAIVPDCNRNKPITATLSAFAILFQMFRHRPHVVVSTGALPGVIGLAVGKLIGARTVWVDSVANGEEMSMSGNLARPFAGLWLTQWEAVSEKSGAEFAGRVI